MYIITSLPRTLIPTRPGLGESVGSVVLRVILFGTIPTEILIVPDIPTDPPSTPELPAVSPFLYSDDSEWRDRVRFHPFLPSGSSSPDTTIPSAEIPVVPTPPAPSTEIATAPPDCDTLTLIITASPAVRSRIQKTSRKSTLGLRPVMTPARSVALRRARRATLSHETSSSSSLSDSTSHTLESSFTASLQGPLTRRRPQCLDYATPTSSSSAGPSRKRSRSSATSIMSAVHTAGALSLDRSDLLPPHKRYKDIEAMTVTATVDGLGIEPVLAEVEMGFELGLAVVWSESEPEEAEADDEADAEIQPEDTIKIGVDVATGIDIPDDLLMPDAIERLGQLEEGMQVIERLRADSLQQRLGYLEDELRQVHELQAYESQRLWRMETFMMRTHDYRP
ncbi:hypothetical protein Tco_0154133 [Tanacetum coccineum]